MHWIAGALSSAALLCAAGVQPPVPERTLWDPAKAWRETTPTRERISINGLWRWQPAAAGAAAVPAGGWGYLRVPEPWPAAGRKAPETAGFVPRPEWDRAALGGAAAAWYEREITAPGEWAGRRISLSAGTVNSYAAVYVDGRPAGEIRYPAGEVDLTAVFRPGRAHRVSLFVVAMPLKAVMLSWNDTAAARQVAGKVARRGLCGDVWLESAPAGPRLGDLKVETSVRRWEIAFDAAVAGLESGASYKLRVRVEEGGGAAKNFESRPFGPGDLANGRFRFTAAWKPAALWDVHTPRNQCRAAVSLVRADGAVLDSALPVRFGFREFWIDGRDFYLNGTRIFLSALPIDNGLGSTAEASYEAARATLRRFKSFGINFVYTHNYGCEPGAHLPYDEILRAGDDEGMLVAFSQPHFSHYDWSAPGADENNGYEQHAAFYVRTARNHPSVVFYSTSHNTTGYGEDMNPELIDGVHDARDRAPLLRNAALALRAEAVIRRLDPGRVVYHHSSGNLGSMHTINFYGNWIPIQEMSDWFAHWAGSGVKPLFTCEYAVPFLWDWSMYRGWYKGAREFGNAAVPWEYQVAEWNAQFLGDAAYRLGEDEKANLRWEAQQFRKGRVWQRWDYPHDLNSPVFEDRLRVVAMYLEQNWRAFRAWGVSAVSPWNYASYWRRRPGSESPPPEIDWEALQRPGPRAPSKREEEALARLAFDPSRFEPTAAARALYRNNMPLLAFLAGEPAAFTARDHNFRAGETVEKQLIVINDSREAAEVRCRWSLELPRPVAGSARATVAPGDQKRIPLGFALPPDLPPDRYALRASVDFGGGGVQEDSFEIDVLPAAAADAPRSRVALFDRSGETAALLDRLGIRFRRVDAAASPAAGEILVIGKGALDLRGAAPDLAAVRGGLRAIVFEQAPDVLERRLGFRVASYGLRQVFRRVPDHPALAGLDESVWHDWRGESTTLPPRLAYRKGPEFNYAPVVDWAGIPVTRVWRAGNRGTVASALIEKPARGDFLPLLDGGYALQYSALLEFREGAGMVVFCQADVSGRSAPDPAADLLARNIFRHVAAWKPAPRRTAAYAGDPEGKRYLESAGVRAAPFDPGALASGGTLIAGPGAGRELAPHAARIARWVESGGRIIAIALGPEDAGPWLPHKTAMTAGEHISSYFAPFPAASPFAGVGPADVHNRDPRRLPLVAKGPGVVEGGVLAAPGGGVVFSQLAPWQFDYSGGRMNVKRTFRRVAFLTSRVLANAGVAGETPLLERFARPPGEREARWLDGLYLDAPEEWDDPYRFFRW